MRKVLVAVLAAGAATIGFAAPAAADAPASAREIFDAGRCIVDSDRRDGDTRSIRIRRSVTGFEEKTVDAGEVCPRSAIYCPADLTGSRGESKG